MSPLRAQPLDIELALLGFLSQRANHGYELHQQLANPSGPGLVWQVKQSHLYALLDRLEQAGYIIGRQRPQDNRPPRTIFRLTPAGRKAFTQWISTPVPHGRQFRQEFLAKFYFALRAGPQAAQRLIEQQQAACRKWRDDLRERAAEAPGPAHFERLVWQFRQGQVDAMLTWLDECARLAAAPTTA
jgi:DNA-binding PadR family transcriptional regulator